ncbi:MAG: zinc-binding dehydrogenase [Chloroflexi bacterium]|nr:zinc-binding dehydrogenase [Chloroflexota bacterium]
MKAVQLTTSGDYFSHYLIDDHETWQKEVRIHEGLSLERFQYRDIPMPAPGPGDVLVEVRGCGLNHLDAWAAKAPPSNKRSEPVTPGADIAGVVKEVGEEVTAVKPGDRVIIHPSVSCLDCDFCLTGRDNLCQSKGGFGGSRDGGLAEYTLAPEWCVIPLPDIISLIDAASLPIVFITTWHMLVARARVQPGDTVLVNAAGSGVGIAAIQIAKLFHARVIASAGSEPKLEKARSLGADEVINYTTHSLHDEAMRLSQGRGLDIVIDSLSGDLAEQSIEALAPGGRFVNCGCTLGNWARINVARMLFKESSVLGSVMGTKNEMLQIVRLVGEGKLKAVVDRVFPLSQTREAVAYLADRKQFGKVVVVPDAHYPPVEGYSTL